MHRARLQAEAFLLAAILFPSAFVARSQDVSPKQPAQLLYTLDEYFALSERARKGDVDGAVAEMGTWNWHAFRDLRDQLERSRRGLEGPSQRVLVKWGRADIEALAMLHTETAIRSARLSTKEASHANWAKQLLGLFDGLNVDQWFRRRWHVAWGAHLQSTLRLRELEDHLHDALRKWPEDPDLLTMAGSVYESLFRRAAIQRFDSDYLPLQSRLRRERTRPAEKPNPRGELLPASTGRAVGPLRRTRSPGAHAPRFEPVRRGARPRHASRRARNLAQRALPGAPVSRSRLRQRTALAGSRRRVRRCRRPAP